MTVDALITGANGQVGWELIRQSGSHNLEIKSFDRTSLDITNAGAVRTTLEASAPKVVINAAAYTAVDAAETEKEFAFAVNRDGAKNLAQSCASLDIPLIHISTDYVFDGTKNRAYSEEDETAPLSVYGASKLAGENAIRQSGVKHIILRTAWVYGVHGQNFVKTMLRLAETRDHLSVVEDQQGCPTFAGDLADAILKIADCIASETVPSDGYGTFHCTGSGQTTWCGFAEKIFEYASSHTATLPTVSGIATSEYPTDAQRPQNSILDCSKLANTYGITLRPWQEALTEMVTRTMAARADNTKGTQ